MAQLIIDKAEETLREYPLADNPYFSSLVTEGLTRADFLKTQEQFYFAVLFFARPMATLVARIPDPKSRLDILHNVVEEHGEFHNEAFHESTFRTFLDRLGSKLENPEQQDLWPCLRAFNAVLVTACTFDEIEVGLACMGVIELRFAEVSTWIAKSLVKQGWLAEGDLIHYSLHEKIDRGHAEDFFKAIESVSSGNDRNYYVQQGLSLGAYVFDRLYRDMYTEVTRKH